MTYEDTFKSVREIGVREGTDPKDLTVSSSQEVYEEDNNIIPEVPLNLDWTNRSLSSVLKDIESLLEDVRYPSESCKMMITSLLKEARVYEDRMTSAIEDVKDFQRMEERFKAMKTEVKKDQKEVELNEYSTLAKRIDANSEE